jgi:ketosteroid isomerase-like protein
MSETTPIDLHRLARAWTDAFNRRDWAAYAAFFAEDVTYLTPGRTEPLVGRDAHVAQDQRNAGTARLVPSLVVVADDGRHIVIEGAFVDETRTSKWVTVLEIREGKIAAERLYFDRLRQPPTGAG